MVLTIKSIVRLFLIFVFFQLTLNTIIEITPTLKPNLNLEDQNYLNFLIGETNIFNSEQQGQTLLTGFVSSMKTEDLFNDGIIESFLGVFKIIGQIILFIIEVGLLILITPSVFMNILVYNFIGTSSLITSMTLLLNISFYMIIFYIIFKARTQN